MAGWGGDGRGGLEEVLGEVGEGGGEEVGVLGEAVLSVSGFAGEGGGAGGWGWERWDVGGPGWVERGWMVED